MPIHRIILVGLLYILIGLITSTSAETVSKKLLIPAHGAYNGAYEDFGQNENKVTLEAIESFANLVGKHQAIIAFGDNWGWNHFPNEQVKVIHNFGAIPLVIWYSREISNETPKTKFSLSSILAGHWDSYIDSWAKAAKALGYPLLVSWGPEMNGNWYPWSGIYYGEGKTISNSAPPRYQGAESYKLAYRHVVERARAAGADNISWVFHVNNISIPDKPWNGMAVYYPGSKYVDWMGISVYGKQTSDEPWQPVDNALDKPYAQLTAVDPSKPILIAEWGVGEFPKQGNKAAWIIQAMARMQTLPHLKGAVFWHERWQNSDLSYSNLRVNSSLESLTAYRTAISAPFWLDSPLPADAVMPNWKEIAHAEH